MTKLTKPVRRSTASGYRVTVTGAWPDDAGKPLVVELAAEGRAAVVRIREQGRRSWVTLDIGELYRRGLIAQSKVGRG